MRDRDTINPYQSPSADEAARKAGTPLRQNRVVDLAIVGSVRGSAIGATLGGGLAALLRGCAVIWTRLVGSGEFGEIAGIEAILAEIVGFATFGAILGAISGLLIGIALGIIASRRATRFRGGLLILSVLASATSGLGWSALLGLMAWGESGTWHSLWPILGTSLVIFTAAVGGAWLAIRIADAAWGRGDLDSLPKSEAKS